MKKSALPTVATPVADTPPVRLIADLLATITAGDRATVLACLNLAGAR